MTELKCVKIFISYGRDIHTELAEKLNNDLKEKGFIVWFDKEKLKEGSDWESYIENGLTQLAEDRENSFLLFLMTPHSTRRPDGYCLNEIAKAILKNITIIPIMVVSSEPPLSICRIQWLDMQDCFPIDIKSQTYQKKFEQLLISLKTKSFEFEGEQKALLKLLEPIDFNDNILRHLINKFTGREWLLRKIDNWFLDTQKSNRIFWITGVPGIGKSAIASWLSEKRIEISAIHFCEFGNQEKTDLLKLIKSLSYQISTQLPDYKHILSHTINLFEILKKYTEPKSLFSKLIIQPLNKISTPDHPITILIDAIDEANKNGVNELADLIATEFEKTPSWLKLIITSRPDNEVMIPLQKLSPYIIDASCDENLTDIKNYLQFEILPYLTEFEFDRKNIIIDEISKKSEGVFLYVKCVCEELKSGKMKLSEIDSFPSSLGAIYTVFFKREFNDLIFFKKNIREAISLIISGYEPIKTSLLKCILNWKDTEFNDFIELLGSLFVVNNRDKDERIYVYHLSLIDWLIDREKSGDYCIPISDGRIVLIDFALKEFAFYKKNFDYKIDDYIIKWLPSLLNDTNKYELLFDLMKDNVFIKLKIELGFEDILFDDFKKLILLSKEKNDFENFHIILTNAFISHNEIYNIHINTFKDLIKTGGSEALLNAFEISKHFKGKEKFIINIILLHNILYNKEINDDLKVVIVTKVLDNIERHFSFLSLPFNYLDLLPSSFIESICYEIENLNLFCDSLLKCCKFKKEFKLDLYNPIIDLHKKITKKRSSNGINYDYKSLLLTSISITFYENGNKDKSTGIAERLEEVFKNYCITQFAQIESKKPFTKSITTTTEVINEVENKWKKFLNTFYKALFEPLIFSIIYFLYIAHNYSHRFLIFTINRIKKLIFHSNSSQNNYYSPGINLFIIRKGRILRDKLKQMSRIDYDLNKKIYSTYLIRLLIFPKNDKIILKSNYLIQNQLKLKDKKIKKRIIEILFLIDNTQDKFYFKTDKFDFTIRIANQLLKNGFYKYENLFLDNLLDKIRKVESETMKNEYIWILISNFSFRKNIPEILLCYLNNDRQIDNKFIKMLSLGDIVFISSNKGKIIELQKEVFETVKDTSWKNAVTGKRGYGAPYYDWSLIHPDQANGLFNENNLETSYTNLAFFIENYQAVRSDSPELYFPEIGGFLDSDKKFRIEELFKEELKLKEELHKKIKDVIEVSFFYFKQFKEVFKSLDSDEVINQKLRENNKWDIIGLMDYYLFYSVNNQFDKANLFLEKANLLMGNFVGDENELFVKVFYELFINKSIDNTFKLLVNTSLEFSFGINFLVLNYLISNNLYYLLELFLAEIISKQNQYQKCLSICWLLDNNLIDLSLKIIEQNENVDKNDELNGIIAFHFSEKNNIEEVKRYLNRINDKVEKDKWIEKSSVIFAKQENVEAVEYLINLVHYKDNKAQILFMVSECFRESVNRKHANECFNYSYKLAKELKINKELKSAILKYSFYKTCISDSGFALDTFYILVKEDLINEKEKNIMIRSLYKTFFHIKDFAQIQNLSYEFSDIIRNNFDVLNEEGYTLDDKNKVVKMKTYIDFFRDSQNVEKNIFDYVAENIKNKEILDNIIYRFSAYLTFSSIRNKKYKMKALKEINEIIKINEWISEVRKTGFKKRF
jgi:hypothetical protein